MRNIFNSWKLKGNRKIPNPVSLFNGFFVDSDNDKNIYPMQRQTFDEKVHIDIYVELAYIRRTIMNDNQDTISIIPNLADKAERLKRFGFINCKDVIDSDKEAEYLKKQDLDNSNRIILTEAINYFDNKYPNYKLITVEAINNICKKHILKLDDVDQYIGIVSDKNLEAIEEFSISEDECCYEKYNRSTTFDFNYYYKDAEEYISTKRYVNKPNAGPMYRPCGLEIIGNGYDFRGGNKINEDLDYLRDSIVLKPVCYKNIKYYLLLCL